MPIDVQRARQDLKSEDWRTRLRAAQALTHGAPPESFDDLLAVATADENGEVRAWALSALFSTGDPRSVEVLTTALRHDEDSRARANAAIFLHYSMDEHAIDPLIEALQDEDDEVQMRAAVSLLYGWFAEKESRVLEAVERWAQGGADRDDEDARRRRWVAERVQSKRQLQEKVARSRAEGEYNPPWLGEDYYQRWLRDAVIGDTFPWDRAQSISLSIFLDQYTLHDSELLGIWLYPGGSATIAFRWDLAWNEQVDVEPDEEELRNPEAREAVPFWPVLIIHFPKLYQVVAKGAPGDEPGSSSVFDVISHMPTDGGTEEHLRRAFDRIEGAQGEWRTLPDQEVPRMVPAPDYWVEEAEHLDSEETETSSSGDEAPVGLMQETVIKTLSAYGLSLLHDPTVLVLLMARSGAIVPIPGSGLEVWREQDSTR